MMLFSDFFFKKKKPRRFWVPRNFTGDPDLPCSLMTGCPINYRRAVNVARFGTYPVESLVETKGTAGRWHTEKNENVSNVSGCNGFRLHWVSFLRVGGGAQFDLVIVFSLLSQAQLISGGFRIAVDVELPPKFSPH
jgi:hypothetical protein